ncbi:MAG TPA: nucleotidyltransferase family protein [Dehalococcoidia bacterium]|nr:nucleotidyltransferase family protein [Dehalococcoidia bacterium]
MVTVADLGVKREDLEALCRRWGVAKLQLFGSRARGEARPDSDVDLMVTFLSDRTPGLWKFVTMKDDFEALFGRPVDLIVEGTVSNPYRKASIDRDLAVVYAA